MKGLLTFILETPEGVPLIVILEEQATQTSLEPAIITAGGWAYLKFIRHWMLLPRLDFQQRY